jgi:uncharacterized protein YkwD
MAPWLVWIVAVLMGLEGTASVVRLTPVDESLEFAIAGPGRSADVVHVIRAKTLHVVAVVLAVVAVAGTASAARPSHSSARQLRSLNHDVAAAINNFRVSHGLTPFHLSPSLNASARQHSVEMGADGYFDHPSADGTVFWKRIQHYYSSNGYRYWTVGENLLWSSGSISASAALNMWIRSPEHLANLRNPNFRDLGVSAVSVPNAGGVYGGDTVTIITTDFGARH